MEVTSSNTSDTSDLIRILLQQRMAQASANTPLQSQAPAATTQPQIPALKYLPWIIGGTAIILILPGILKHPKIQEVAKNVPGRRR
jgi:hypothetical protein